MIDEETIQRQYQEHLRQFEEIKDQVFKSLQRVAQTFYRETKFQVYIPQPRLKSISSVIAKLENKGSDAPSLFSQDGDSLKLVVNDFLGCRILCNTKEDVQDIINILENSARFKHEDNENWKQAKIKDSGYRAFHLDMFYQVFWEDDQTVYIPIEIQIKTHLQHAWAEITHDESYKPEKAEFKNEWETRYSKHMADILDRLDDMASTIRSQRLSFVEPEPLSVEMEDSDTVINSKTLSYRIASLRRNEKLTQQEMSLVLRRLSEEGFSTMAEVVELLQGKETEQRIKSEKENLKDNRNVTTFEMLYYGSLLLRGKDDSFDTEIRKDYGYVEDKCLECGSFLTIEEYQFIREKTDSDVDYYCGDHRVEYFPNQCACGVFTSGTSCKRCEADRVTF